MHLLPLLAGLAGPIPTPPAVQVPDSSFQTDAGAHVAPLPEPMSISGALAFARGQSAPAASSSGAGSPLTTISLNSGVEGDMPRDLAITPDGSTVLVVCRDTDSVNFFDTATGAMTGSLDVLDYPVHVDISPDGQLAVVACTFSNSVSVIDISSRAVLGSVLLGGGGPYRVQITSDSARAIVSLTNGGTIGRVSVVDLATLTETNTFITVRQAPVGLFASPSWGVEGLIYPGWALTPDDTWFVLADYFSDRVVIYDVTTGQFVQAVTGAVAPTDVDISDDGTLAVVAYNNSFGFDGTDGVGLIDLTNMGLTSFGPTSTFLAQARITPDKQYALVNVQGGTDMINLTTGVIDSLAVGNTLGEIEFSFDGRYATVAGLNAGLVDLSTRTVASTLGGYLGLDIVASPNDHRLFVVDNRQREDLEAYTATPASFTQLWSTACGVPVEMDAPSGIDVLPDGRRAVVVGSTSDNVALVDLVNQTVLDYIGVGRGPREIAVDANGEFAVVANYDSRSVSVVDLTLRQMVAELPVPMYPWEVEVSPDGTRAYVRGSDMGDAVWFFDLAGAATQATGSISQTGGNWQHLELSPDGSVLSVLDQFAHEVVLIDPQAESILVRVPVDQVPFASDFAPDGDTIYVSSFFEDSVTSIDVQGAASAVRDVRALPAKVWDLVVDAGDDFIYCIANNGLDDVPFRVHVLDTATLQTVTEVDLPIPFGSTFYPYLSTRLGDQLFVVMSGGDIVRIDMAGAQSATIELITPSGSPNTIATSPELGLVLLPQPGAQDALDLLHFGGTSTRYCSPAVPNSSGQSAVIDVAGTFLAGEQPVRLSAGRLPQNQFGYFLVGESMGFTQPAASQGNLCLATRIGRYATDVMSSGAAGTMELDIDIQALPLTPPAPVVAGETWHFQGWFRDLNPGQTSNFTDAVAVSFE
ncbi:MAG: hypothetical protein GY711_17490 [bacterium]|nr:hypothetical protein [bacterium]